MINLGIGLESATHNSNNILKIHHSNKLDFSNSRQINRNKFSNIHWFKLVW